MPDVWSIHRNQRSPVDRIAGAAIRSATAHLQTFTSWCAVLHVAYAAALLLGPGSGARRWLFPIVHFNVWAVLVGSHVLLWFRPRALSEHPLHGVAVGRHRAPIAFAGHLVFHVAPALALATLDRAWPRAEEMSPLGLLRGTALAVLFGTTYASWKVKPDNPYHVGLRQMRVMMVCALVAGLIANLAAFVRMS
jgi:hypothetical protein